ncbi:hypothetical protein JTB14_014830 [Gonioctena quinquepunctata]|nr:hypothetical protein JTB14_014830 [Gonioctena quinquepunctata]
MLLPRLLLVLALLGVAFSNSTTPASSQNKNEDYSEGISAEANHSAPPVNVSVSGMHNSTAWASLAKTLDFYNSEQLAANWGSFKGGLTQGCQKDVGAYIDGPSVKRV